MHPTKVLGPDGFPAAYFQKHWQSMNNGVINIYLHILNDSSDI